MDLFLVILFTTGFVCPVFCSRPAWLFDGHSCLSDESAQIITLSSNGQGSSVSVSMLKDSRSYLPGSNCTITFEAFQGQQLLLSFEVIDTRPCPQDNVTVETESSNKTLCGNHMCPGSDCPEYSFSGSPNFTIDFQSAPGDQSKIMHTGFQGTITAYSLMDQKTKGCPGDDRFKCANGHCIWEGFHCDGHNHCGDGSDEPPGCAKTMWGVLVIVLGVISVCFFLPLFCFLAVWGPRRKVPVRIMGTTFFRSKESSAINDEESVPILVGQPVQGTMPGETFTFYYGTGSSNNPRC